MDNFTCVRPEHLNQHGFLFGGQMLRWVDEFAWLAVTRDFPACKFVTVAIDKCVFRKSALCGSILRFEMHQARRGTTSVTYDICVHSTPAESRDEYVVFTTTVTFVRVDENGRKLPLPTFP